MNKHIFQRIFLPGFLFQSVVMGGGYATGRELVEFFLQLGPVGGLLSMAVATLSFSLITAISFELARMTMSYTYRSFFTHLLGRGRILYELAYYLLGLLVIAVIGSAAGEIALRQAGIPAAYGTAFLVALIGFLVFFGTALIERVLAGWSFLLYVTYAVFVILYLAKFGNDLSANLTEPPGGEWFVSGIRYVGFNLATIPIIFFCVAHMQSRRDALLAGALAGPLAMIPAFLLFLPMIASYPEILDAAVPSDFMIQRLDANWIAIIFYLVLFGTFVETGTAYIHALNERIAETYREKGKLMPPWLRVGIAVAVLIASVVLATQFGLIRLIADGYGTLTWFFILVFAVPLLTRGVWIIFFSGSKDVTGLPGSVKE